MIACRFKLYAFLYTINLLFSLFITFSQNCSFYMLTLDFPAGLICSRFLDKFDGHSGDKVQLSLSQTEYRHFLRRSFSAVVVVAHSKMSVVRRLASVSYSTVIKTVYVIKN